MTQTKPLNAEHLSLILDVSEFTIKKLAKTGELPCMYDSKREPRFDLEKILEHFGCLEEEIA